MVLGAGLRVAEIPGWYRTPLGLLAQEHLRAGLVRLLGRESLALAGEVTAGFGYSSPMGETEVVLIPEALGGLLPSGGRRVLVHECALPMGSMSLDCVLAAHALEHARDVDGLFDEFWRVLSGSGRLVLMVASRRGWWIHDERTPFALGQPYTSRQVMALGSRHGFSLLGMTRALGCPSWFMDRFPGTASVLESRLTRARSCGVLLLMFERQMYRPSLVGRRVMRPLVYAPA